MIFSQLLICLTKGKIAEVFLTEYAKNQKLKIFKSINAHIGENGASYNIFEGSGTTPKGLFSIKEGFYKTNKPESGIPLFRIEENTVWVDDPESSYYNTKATKDVFCKSYEQMYKIDGYEYGFVIDYNREPAVAYKGSAIFFHIGNCPTKGCIAVKKEDMLYILKFLDIHKSPHILII